MAAARSTPSTPKDAQVMASILKEIGIQDYEPRVLNQMLEFTYRYLTNLVDDSQVFSTHAKNKTIEKDDIKVAADFNADKYFTIPPPRELLISVARQKNSTQLPLIKSTSGVKLPPDRYSLTSCNYRMKHSTKKLRGLQSSSRLGMAVASPPVVPKFSSVGMNGKGGSAMSAMTKPSSASTVTVFPRSIASTSAKATAMKLPDSSANLPPIPLPNISIGNSMPSQIIMASETKPQISLPTIPEQQHGEKRKLEDSADDYDAE